jgi:hypothetical protein
MIAPCSTATAAQAAPGTVSAPEQQQTRSNDRIGKRRDEMKKKTLAAAVFVGLLGISSFSSEARADSIKGNCTVTALQVDSRLAIWCASDSTVYYVFSAQPTGATGCALASMDKMKMWQSLIQSALLSGHPIDFAYRPSDTACGVPSLTSSVKLH